MNKHPRHRIPSNKIEHELVGNGYRLVAGVDEVGRGAWAGPVVAAAVILPSKRLNKIRDSKQLTREDREKLSRKIRRQALTYSIAIIDVKEVDRTGIGKASFTAMRLALDELSKKPDYVLVDGFKIPGVKTPQQAVVKGDQKISCIAAASIIAKVERDKIMRKLHRETVECKKYRFDLNKGYPSPLHKKMLEKHGPCKEHRFSFTPIRQPKLLKEY